MGLFQNGRAFQQSINAACTDLDESEIGRRVLGTLRKQISMLTGTSP